VTGTQKYAVRRRYASLVRTLQLCTFTLLDLWVINEYTMKITLKRLDYAFHMEATNEAGHTVQSDGSEQIGGHNLGMRPMEMLISSLGSCSSIDVINFLRKMRQPLQDIRMEIQAERDTDNTPSLFTAVHLAYHLYGDLDAAKVEKAVSMSVDKYCSVARILEKTATITWSYQIHPTS